MDLVYIVKEREKNDDLKYSLRSIAKFYPELYTNDNNKNRTLDKELAISRNNRLLEVYKQNPKCIVIEGCKDIKEKQEKVIKAIEKHLICKKGWKRGKRYDKQYRYWI